jgi:light-regulated signal transduction histidine kinase (bacteriophytochrome)
MDGVDFTPTDRNILFGYHFKSIAVAGPIVRKYLDLMRGDIRVESRPEEGSTFTFSLPRSVPLDT